MEANVFPDKVTREDFIKQIHEKIVPFELTTLLELTKLKSHSEIELEDKLEMLKQSLWGINKYQQMRKLGDKNYRSFMNVS